MGNYSRQLKNQFPSGNTAAPEKNAETATTLSNLHDKIEQEYSARRSRVRVEDGFIRVTFLLDRNLNDRLNKICASRERGFKTLCLNRAIEAIVNEYENDKA